MTRQNRVVTLSLQVDSDKFLDTYQAARWSNSDLLTGCPHSAKEGGHNK